MHGATNKVIRALGDDGTLSAEHDPRMSWDDLRFVYRHMVETRLLDERLTALQRQGRIGFHVGCLGEEAAIIGSAFAMRKQDWIFPCYREFGAALMRGLPFQRFIDNMFGNANDTVKGRQMPDHYTSRQTHWLSISSPVGTQITHGVGLAWAAKLKNEDAASLIYFGDGDTDVPSMTAGAVTLASGIVVTALFVAARRQSVRVAPGLALRWLLPGALVGLSYVALFEAFYRGTVSVVAPIVGTESLWGVAFSALLLRRTERVGLRLVAGACLVVAGAVLIGAFR